MDKKQAEGAYSENPYDSKRGKTQGVIRSSDFPDLANKEPRIEEAELDLFDQLAKRQGSRQNSKPAQADGPANNYYLRPPMPNSQILSKRQSKLSAATREYHEEYQ